MPSALAGNAVERFIIGYRNARSGAPEPPNPKQALAHASEADELLYGGAAFGGKSEYAIWEAIAICLQIPGCDVAIFRRTHTELEHDLINRFLKYVPRHIAKYNDSKKIARFYNGSRLLFCYCHTERDKFRYQSDQWTALIIDQAEHFTESIALYLFSRVRTSIPGVHCKIRLTANPGGVGHAWLKARYVAPAPEDLGDRPLPNHDGEIWRPLPNPNLADDDPLTRAFIQAKMTDNVPGMIADPKYVQRIRANPNEQLRRMLEEGDWDAFEGQMFSMWKPSKLVTSTDMPLLEAGLSVNQTIPWHVVPDPFWRPPQNVLIYGSVDYGYGEPWSCKFRAAMPDGHLVAFKEFYQVKVRDVEQARKIRAWIEAEYARLEDQRLPKWKIGYIVMDVSMWGSRMEHGLAKSRAEVYVDELASLNIPIIPSPAGPNTRKARLQRMLEALSPAPDGFPWAQYTSACPNFIRTLPQLIVDPEDPDDILHGKGNKKQEDHAYDDDAYFLASRPPFPAPDRSGEDGNAGPLIGFGGQLRAVAGGRR
jgi:hypothetical protein